MISKAILTFAVLFMGSAGVQADSRDWTMKELNGGSFSRAEDGGESPCLLLFWATWCVPCKKELADHQTLLDEYVKQGVKVLLVSEDNQRSQSKIKPFIESKKYTWPVLLDPSGELLKRYGGINLPYTVLLDKNGGVQMKINGAISNTKVLSTKISELLGSSSD